MVNHIGPTNHLQECAKRWSALNLNMGQLLFCAEKCMGYDFHFMVQFLNPLVQKHQRRGFDPSSRWVECITNNEDFQKKFLLAMPFFIPSNILPQCFNDKATFEG